MHAEIVMIGTELLLGELVDTNANRLAIGLRSIGMDLYYKTSVGDNEDRITDVINLALERSDIVITSGGLGPTVDDITRQAVATATGRSLVYSEELEKQIASRFRNFGRKMADNNKRQAYLPDGATPLENPVGTAPCFLSEDTKGRGCVITLPGVPRELEYMLENVVIPILVERMGGVKVTKVHTLRTCAVGESNIDRAIDDLMTSGNPTVGLAAHAGQTDVRIAAKADTEQEADDLIDEMETKLRERLGIAIYGTGKETVAEVVGEILSEKDLNLGVVDTLTDGQLTRELDEAGFGALLSTNLTEKNPNSAIKSVGLDAPSEDPLTLATSIAEKIAPPGGLGLAMLGPFEKNATFISLIGPNGLNLSEQGRNFQDSDHIRRWLVIQGLDWIRRSVLDQLDSPVDWNRP